MASFKATVNLLVLLGDFDLVFLSDDYGTLVGLWSPGFAFGAAAVSSYIFSVDCGVADDLYTFEFLIDSGSVDTGCFISVSVSVFIRSFFTANNERYSFAIC